MAYQLAISENGGVMALSESGESGMRKKWRRIISKHQHQHRHGVKRSNSIGNIISVINKRSGII